MLYYLTVWDFLERYSMKKLLEYQLKIWRFCYGLPLDGTDFIPLTADAGGNKICLGEPF